MKNFFVKIGRWFKSLFVTVEPAVEPRLKTFWKKDGTQRTASSILAILAGLLIGSIVLIVYALLPTSLSIKGAFEGIRIILGSVFYTGRVDGKLTFGFNPNLVGNMLFEAMPLILTGLSVAIAFKTGLFNIGASGQYVMGACATMIVALSIDASKVSPVIVWILAFLAGVLAGFVWGLIPGVFKALLNVNEVITCIMTNWIALYLSHWFFEADYQKGLAGHKFVNLTENTKSGFLYKSTHNNGLSTFNFGLDKLFPDSKVSGGILIAIILAIVISVIINKTTFGYELKACGANRHASKYAGIKDSRSIILSMAMAGALAAAAASLYFLSGTPEYAWTNNTSLPAAGFNGIVVSLLAQNSPIGCIFAALFMGYINIGGNQLSGAVSVNSYICDLIVAIIVYLSAFSLLFRGIISGDLFKNRKHKETKKSGKEA